jgi:predicted nucleic acid-binding protein
MEMKVVLDTNILIDYLGGLKKAKKELKEYDHAYISLITWIEILVGANDRDEEHSIEEFLSRFEIVPITKEIARESIELRKKYGMRLPDAIIWASAQINDALLVTRNTKDFPKKDPGIRVPYQI